MGKSTIILVTLAALGLGALIGVSLVDSGPVAINTQTPVAGSSSSTSGAPVYRYLSPDDIKVEHDEFGQALPSTAGENFITRNTDWKSETVSIALDLDAAVEYKAIMDQGDSIVFNWKSDGGSVYYDFHAHDESFGEEFFTRYDEGEAVSRFGSIVAAYGGQHGWYLMNIADQPITITLEVAGFYDEVIEIEVETY